MQRLGSHWMDFHDILYLSIFVDLWRKFNVRSNLTRKTGTLQEELYTFLIITRIILLRKRNFSDKRAEKIRTHILRSIIRKSCRYEIMCEKYGTAGQAT
jgi:hypothetical protein